MELIKTPALDCPVASAINPQVQRAEDYALDWAQRMGLIGEGDRWGVGAARIGHLASYALPEASWEALQIGVAYLDWLMIYDDARVDKRVNVMGLDTTDVRLFHQQVLEILQGSREQIRGQNSVEDGLYRGILDLRESITRVCPGWDMSEFVRGFSHYFQSNMWEVTNMWQAKPPLTPTYMNMRRHTGCLFPTYRLSAALNGIDLPLDVWDHVALHQLEIMANNYTCWINDVYSFQRELVDGHVNSLVMSLRHSLDLSSQEALDRAAELCQLEAEAYVELETRLPELGLPRTPDVEAYLRILRSWMRALYDWHQMTGRYVVAAS